MKRIACICLVTTLAMLGDRSVAQVPALDLPEIQQELTTPAAQVTSRVHDLSKAIEHAIKNSKLSPTEAKQQAIRELFAPVSSLAKLVRREELSPGKFRVVATEAFHEQLAFMSAWLLNDEKQICVEVRVMDVTAEQRSRLTKNFGRRWKFRSELPNEQDILPQLVPTESTGPMVDLKLGHSVAQSTVTQPSPCRILQLSKNPARDLVDAFQSDPRTNVLQMPKVTLFPEQQGTMSDTTKRPFVTSVRSIEKDAAIAEQPIITVLDEGFEIQFRASFVKGHLRLDSKLTFSKVSNVEEVTFDYGDGQGVTLQIPEHHQQKVSVSEIVRSGASLLIDPHFSQETKIERRFGRDETNRSFKLILITPTVIKQQIEEQVAAL